jgi:hypothetical protein
VGFRDRLTVITTSKTFGQGASLYLETNEGQETGDRRQKAGDRRQETGDRRQEKEGTR